MEETNEKWYLSTVAEGAEGWAERYGLGLEIAEFCTAANMDVDFARRDSAVRRKLAGAARASFHLPFNELCPAAIDPKALELARSRYRQGLELAATYGVHNLVVHSGYVPHVYFKIWFVEQSVVFWKDFLRTVPAETVLCMENVLEDGPESLVEIVRRVDDPRLRICLDVGHANSCISHTPVAEWIAACAPYLAQVHLHNNDGDWDLHAPLGAGTIDMAACITQVEREAPWARLVVESMEMGPSVEWLLDHGFIRA